MLQKVKIFLLLIVTMVMGVVVTSCNNAENQLMEAPLAELRASNLRSANGMKMPVYMEVNSTNPLNAGEYYYCPVLGTDTVYVFDYVILFAANIRGNCTNDILYCNPNVADILRDVNQYVRPLQAKGIKVLLGVLGDHTGLGFANLSSAQINSFAQKIANAVSTYGLDGVDFDDEYADYWNLSCSTTPNSTTYRNLIARVRQLLPTGKLVTAYCIGYAGGINPSDLSYAWNPWYGTYNTTPCISGLPNSKWAAYSVNMNSPQANNILRARAFASSNAGVGAILCYDLHANNANNESNTLTWLVRGAYSDNTKTICWTGTSHSLNYPDGGSMIIP